jgi:hypothetical protein
VASSTESKTRAEHLLSIALMLRLLLKPKRCLYRVHYFFGARVCMRDP